VNASSKLTKIEIAVATLQYYLDKMQVEAIILYDANLFNPIIILEVAGHNGHLPGHWDGFEILLRIPQ
jgi:hypothetical protein